MTSPPRSNQALIDELARSAGVDDAATAIRLKARALIELFVSTFGEATMPLDMDVLASLRGIARSGELPMHSRDAELVPDGDGRVKLRVNPDRPDTRQRFSVAHEISHTFFPDYSTKIWCRPDARYRDRNNADDYLEMLCDIGAAELLFPLPWFTQDAVAVTGADGIIQLASRYRASREATLRRFAETSPTSLAAVFFAWKLKPTQKRTVGREDQGNLFGVPAEEARRDALRLRIEYAIPSEAFRATGLFLPKDKSMENEGPVFQAASTGVPIDGEGYIDMGQASGTYRVWALPVWTPDDELGACGENTVAAILQPLKIPKSRKKKTNADDRSLFGET